MGTKRQETVTSKEAIYRGHWSLATAVIEGLLSIRYVLSPTFNPDHIPMRYFSVILTIFRLKKLNSTLDSLPQAWSSRRAAMCSTHMLPTVHPVTSALPSAQGWAGIVSGFTLPPTFLFLLGPDLPNYPMSSPRKTDMALLCPATSPLITPNLRARRDPGSSPSLCSICKAPSPHQTLLEVLF